METSTSDQQRSYPKPVHVSHLDLLRDGTLSDVTFIIGPTKKRIECHQLFLIARSPVFKVMFSERWTQGSNREVSIEDIDPKIFKKFLQFIYADTLVANVSEALELLQVAHRYDVQLLISRCEELLLANKVPVKDVLDVFLVAQKYGKIQLMHKAGYLMAIWLSEFQSLPSFSRVDKEILVYILKKDSVRMKEVDIFLLALKWTTNQSDSVRKEIMSLIRFPTMTLQELTASVVPTGLLSKDTLFDIFMYLGTEDAKTKRHLASKLKFNTHSRRLTHSNHYVNLYPGDPAKKKTKLVELKKLLDSVLISTRITGTTAMGINGVSVYCPARVERAAPGSSTFKEFKVVVRAARKDVEKSSKGSSYKDLLCMYPFKIEEGKITEIKFDTAVPLENNTDYRIAIEEFPSTYTQGAAATSTKDEYVVKVFGSIRNCYLTLNIVNNSAKVEGERKNLVPKEDDELPQLIYKFGLQEL